MAPLPKDLEAPFLEGVATYGKLYALAARLGEVLAQETRPVCLSTQDRLQVAGALLCALAGKAELVVPHALSARVLREAQAQTGFGRLLGEPVEDFEHIAPPDACGAAPPPALLAPGSRPCLWLFTGGSTGRPVCFGKTPENLLGEAALHCAKFGVGPADLFLSTVPPLHIYGLLFSVLVPLLGGAQVVPATAFLPAEIGLRLGAGPTVLVSGPTHYRALRETPLSRAALRLGLSSGGPLDQAAGERFAARTGSLVVEILGSTETGGIATRTRAQGETDWTPLSPVQIAFEDERLLVASPFLSPEIGLDSRGFFHTADRARPTEAGRFALGGRLDGIVKVAGKRVDLAEVEAKLRALPGIEDVCLVVYESPGRLVEIIALLEGTACEDALRAALAREIEPLALPRRFVRVDRIPTTPAGKRDREAIEALLGEGSRRALFVC